MASKKASNAAENVEVVEEVKKEIKEPVVEVEPEELDLDKKVNVHNIAGWDVGFARIDGVGDIRITAEGNVRLSRNEIISQVQNGNRLFAGIDGNGSHATLYIEDAPTRKELSFDSDDGSYEQVVLSDSSVKELFDVKKDFENALKKTIVTRAEKFAVIQAIKRLKINDFSKIRMVENHTGYRVG